MSDFGFFLFHPILLPLRASVRTDSRSQSGADIVSDEATDAHADDDVTDPNRPESPRDVPMELGGGGELLLEIVVVIPP